jgi:hypothetical protein
VLFNGHFPSTFPGFAFSTPPVRFFFFFFFFYFFFFFAPPLLPTMPDGGC